MASKPIEPTTDQTVEKAFARFQCYASIALGTLIGLLIAVPLALPSGQGLFVVIPFGMIGALIGYRRRASRPFLYFAFVAVLVLAALISNSLLYSRQVKMPEAFDAALEYQGQILPANREK